MPKFLLKFSKIKFALVNGQKCDETHNKNLRPCHIKSQYFFNRPYRYRYFQHCHINIFSISILSKLCYQYFADIGILKKRVEQQISIFHHQSMKNARICSTNFLLKMSLSILIVSKSVNISIIDNRYFLSTYRTPLIMVALEEPCSGNILLCKTFTKISGFTENAHLLKFANISH